MAHGDAICRPIDETNVPVRNDRDVRNAQSRVRIETYILHVEQSQRLTETLDCNVRFSREITNGEASIQGSTDQSLYQWQEQRRW